MKSILRKYIFWFKVLIHGLILSIFMLLSIYYLDEKMALPTVVVAILSTIITLFLIYIILTLDYNFNNPLCTYEINAKLIDYIPQYDGADNVPSYNNFSDIVTIEYIYKDKKYRKIINVHDIDDYREKGSKIKIKICKFFPKIIHIEKVSK